MMHRHHIVPRYAGGTNDPDNIKILTIEEHAEAHRLLWENNGDRRDFLAWQMLSKRITKKDLIHEWCSMGGKSRLGIPQSEETKRKISNSHIGLKSSEETKRKISESKKGNQYQLGLKRTSESKMKMRKSHLGKKHKKESKEKRSIAMKEVWKNRRLNNDFEMPKHTDQWKKEQSNRVKLWWASKRNRKEGVSLY